MLSTYESICDIVALHVILVSMPSFTCPDLVHCMRLLPIFLKVHIYSLIFTNINYAYNVMIIKMASLFECV